MCDPPLQQGPLLFYCTVSMPHSSLAPLLDTLLPCKRLLKACKWTGHCRMTVFQVSSRPPRNARRSDDLHAEHTALMCNDI